MAKLDLPHLPYLEVVVKETFRLYPSTPVSLPCVAAESCEIFGYHIRKGVTLLVNVCAIARDPNEWPNPLEFKPKRFFSSGEKTVVDVRGNNFEFIPFGVGSRICARMSLGLRMVKLLTATLAPYAFYLELENGLNPKKLNMDEAYVAYPPKSSAIIAPPSPKALITRVLVIIVFLIWSLALCDFVFSPPSFY